ncbi:MAG TPA: hypothetical protein DHW60_03505 [Ruminococcus sp.]|nr:hypothetical protein [Ruminococcus sp.]
MVITAAEIITTMTQVIHHLVLILHMEIGFIDMAMTKTVIVMVTQTAMLGMTMATLGIIMIIEKLLNNNFKLRYN